MDEINSLCVFIKTIGENPIHPPFSIMINTIMTKQDKIKEAHRLLDIVMEIFESIFSKLDDLEIKHIETSKMENIMEIRAAEGGNIDKLWPK